MPTARITWTKVDEAPALATHAFLPILEAFVHGTGVEVETADISLAGRILANFPERLREDQRVPDELTRLGNIGFDKIHLFLELDYFRRIKCRS